MGGHFRAGERTGDIAREIQEEIGVRIPKRDLTYLGRRIDISISKRNIKREIAEVYFSKIKSFSSQEFHLDPAEISAIVEILISNGLKLFSGEARSVEATRWSERSGKWRPTRNRVTTRNFVPKADSYYACLFLMAKRFLAGKKYLAI